ncbi:hypothetical protein NYO99_14405 [Pelomonas sp. UHG3]|uniref:Uncharacterized protein n=1 Tax=Roseateles hydrophilus TaxID=2975054 RepID=A0ACC6CCT5_9BURK|nr:hypothetical protein [Pelomonas sp. UHG3]MCY4746175.1 hypothetical protein [Pelomonas sp. UHG3]
MTKKKFFGTLTFVAAMFVAIVALGQVWILNSAPYEIGRVAVATKLGVQAESVALKRLAAFEFKDGDFSGQALFVLCGPESACFTVVTRKNDGRWAVVDLIPRG